MPGLIDIGANLTHDSFDADRASVLLRAHAAGVERIIITGSDGASARRAVALAAEAPGRVYATAGLHPHHAQEWSGEHAAIFEELSQSPHLVALGECGLDYFRDLSPRDRQRAAFLAQVELAIRLQRPLFLHQREAHEDFLAILREHRASLPGVVVHCFTDSRDALHDYLSLDCHIGITGWICDERRGKALQGMVGDIPADRLMIETDAPYLLPRTLKPAPGSRRNEPMYLPEVLRVVAMARGEAAEATARATRETTLRFFGLATPLPPSPHPAGLSGPPSALPTTWRPA